MIEKFTVTFPAPKGPEPRDAYVYLPDALAEHPDLRCPVLYMFDGHNVFFDEDATYGKSWGLGAYLDEVGVPLIVAAVQCNTGADNGRLSEYSPYDFSDPHWGKFKGRGRKTMNWFVNEFKPYIDETYPTLPDRAHTFIAGSSMGGLMTLYAVTQYNRVFSRGAALSPSIWVSPEGLRATIEKARIRKNTVLYMDYGEKEMGNHPDMLAGYGAFAVKLMQKGVLLTSRIVPGGTHCEASWEQQLPNVFEAMLYGLDWPEELDEIFPDEASEE